MKTNKKLFAVIFFLTVINMAHGQIQFGIQAGISGVTQSDFSNIYDNDDRFTGINAGVTIRKPFNEIVALKTNLFYSLKGRSFDTVQDGKDLEQTDKFSYLVVPVKLEYSIPIFNDRFFAASGPYTGLLLNANREVDGTSSDIDKAKEFDFGWTFELGYSKLLSGTELQFSINYDMGLTKIVDYEDDLQNKALVVNVGLLF